MISIFLIAILVNIFMTGLLVQEHINDINQANSPFGRYAEFVITAYNLANHSIPNSTSLCRGKLQCLQLMCTTSQISKFNTMMIYPVDAWLNTQCNLTMDNSVKEFYNKWKTMCILALACNIIIVISSFVSWIMWLAKWNYWYVPLILTLLSFVVVIVWIVQLAWPLIFLKEDIIILRDSIYRRIYNIALLGFYLIFYILFLWNITEYIVMYKNQQNIIEPEPITINSRISSESGEQLLAYYSDW